MISRLDRRAVARSYGSVALLPAAAIVVHQVRFMLAFGGGAGLELQRTGHAYLHSLAPWIVLLVGLAVGGFLRRLGRALGGQASVARDTLSLSGLWLACTVSLVGIFVLQEYLEGLSATGHPAGLAGIFGYGGWWAIPAAACVGLVLASLLLGARRVLIAVAARGRRSWLVRTGRVVAARRPCDALVPRVAPLAGGSSGRGPPS